VKIIDRLIVEADNALRVLAAPASAARQAPVDSPASAAGDCADEAQRRQSVRLMRINHAGEVAAQALYRGQACFAREAELRDQLHQAADEEHDHLAWCEQRLNELGGRTSLFNPLWYGGAFVLGTLAGLAGRPLSLGFLAETERQVAAHLDDHLARLPAADQRSRELLERMRDEEIGHGNRARERGGIRLPAPLRQGMWLASRLMTGVSGWR